jgi:peptidoglycan/xylan/chitin deacetylase (PgdA/CDA1 family)
VRTPIPILLYHSVSDRPTGQFGPYTVSRQQFASHLDLLQDQGFSTLTVGQLVQLRDEQLAALGRVALVTVDDGFADFHRNAWPELAARGMAATLYVVSGALDGRSAWLDPLDAGDLPMLSRAQLRELAAEGCEIGAHSRTHPQLDCIPLPRAQQEVRDSKTALEDVLEREVTTFAYPHGYHDRRVRQLVVEAGYSSATAVRNALSHEQDDRFALARLTVLSHFGPGDLTHALHGRSVKVARNREQWRTRGWRQVRRHRYRQAVRTGQG